MNIDLGITLNPACIYGAAREDTEHYLPHCPQFSTLRLNLFGQISDAGFDIANMTSKDLCHLLLYCKPNGSTLVNTMTLAATTVYLLLNLLNGSHKHFGVAAARLSSSIQGDSFDALAPSQLFITPLRGRIS